MARTLPTAGLSPIDSYVVDGGNRAAGYFEQVVQTNQASGAYTKGLEARVKLGANTTYAIPIQIGYSMSGTPTIEAVYGIFMYMGAIAAGATVTNFYAQSLVLNNTVAAGYMSFFRIYVAGSGTVNSVFHLANSGGTPVTNLFDFEGQVAPVQATGSGGGTRSHRIPCLVETTTFYLSLYTD